MPNKPIRKSIIPAERIESRIFHMRGKNVMLTNDLAELYGVPAKALNQAVKRNRERFPSDFVFRMSKKETSELVTKCDRFIRLKHTSSFPYAFTEHGVAMLSSILNSPIAIQVNIEIIRTFIQLKNEILSHQDLLLRICELEKKYDHQFQMVFQAIKLLVEKTKEGPGRRF